jgi:hypothetical protein
MADITRALDAAHETRVARTKEARELQDAICVAMRAYWDYLDRNGLLFTDGEYPEAKCDALVVTMTNDGDIDILLNGGALDRLYR